MPGAISRRIMVHEENDVVNAVLSVRECMERYGIKSIKTVMLAIWTSRVDARKLDEDEGVRGGQWIISLKSADKKWGYKLREIQS